MDNHGESYWVCRCSCRNNHELIVPRSNLIRGHTTSCGCKIHERDREDLTGRQFGRLTVISYDHSDNNHITHWLCRCSCGKTKIVSRTNLFNGGTVSCGCYLSESARDRFTTHNGSKTPLYEVWHGMRQRCTNSNHKHYDHYGGRGIDICDEWDNFENFRDWANENGYEPGLSIDRKNNDGGYSPDNCRWTDWHTQLNNKSNNHYISYAGERDTLANWARKLNVNYSTLQGRVRRGDMRDFEKYFG